MSKGFKIVLAILLFIIITSIVVVYGAYPREILGNNAVKYLNGEIVYTMKKPLYTTLFGPLKKGDVILFVRPDMDLEGIAVIVGLPGEEAPENAYYFSNEKVDTTIPIDSYLIRFGESTITRVVSELSITAVAWLPIRP